MIDTNSIFAIVITIFRFFMILGANDAFWTKQISVDRNRVDLFPVFRCRTLE